MGAGLAGVLVAVAAYAVGEVAGGSSAGCSETEAPDIESALVLAQSCGQVDLGNTYGAVQLAARAWTCPVSGSSSTRPETPAPV
ncbi:hypothetical protein CUD01_18780 [Cellulomonas uda]|uniref:Uncharacterized protein n=1 Tax=Cellulomonas uda TaxID=1714 RepID=A0A4Y3KDI5_CELUD|nr:hypothetical protein CUD01_18780 [Cellulomonas uda]